MNGYTSTKTFGHDLGLSACFRQWRAEHSHCSFLHGYALSVHLEFYSTELNVMNWVMDFGAFDEMKQFLRLTFDHKLLVAEDDPMKDELCALAGLGLADVLVVPATGCEAFAKLVFDRVNRWLQEAGHAPRVKLNKAEIREHGANSASYFYWQEKQC